MMWWCSKFRDQVPIALIPGGPSYTAANSSAQLSFSFLRPPVQRQVPKADNSEAEREHSTLVAISSLDVRRVREKEKPPVAEDCRGLSASSWLHRSSRSKARLCQAR
jgi:hypothetical protein